MSIKKKIFLILLSVMLISCELPFGSIIEPPYENPPQEENHSDMTPYPCKVSSDEFACGTTFELPSNLGQIYPQLKEAHDNYNLNTITVYGLENKSYDVKRELFRCLKNLNMKIVVRIEAYDSDFAFRKEDAEVVVEKYQDLISFIHSNNFEDSVLYFAVNMPVDDPNVQRNTGGLNSSEWKNAQKEYAEEIIKQLRSLAATPLYLSIFYGWNNDFEIPSYKSAGADGYFMNNYSYPKKYNYGNWQATRYDDLPSKDMSDEDLINASRLSISMNKFRTQYGNDSKLIMEWGFHTAEFNHNKPTQQSAGLVQDSDAKKKALSATYDFYRKNYPFVKGCLYFGYNLYKEEGNPPAVMDWCLKY